MTNKKEKQKVVCPVCSGKGGFTRAKIHALDDNYIDCPQCDGYGFVDETITEDECRDLLLFSNYRTKIMNELCRIGDVKAIGTEKVGKDMIIIMTPYPKHKRAWVALVKLIVKFSHYNKKLNIISRQDFFYNEETDSPDFQWEFIIEMDSIMDLDGFLDILAIIDEY